MPVFQLYHACDQDVYTVCVVKYSVLEFCDTFTGVMSYWVTVVTISSLPDTLRSLFHMVGTVGVALAVQNNRDSLLTFTLPIVLGLTTLVISWVTFSLSPVLLSGISSVSLVVSCVFPQIQLG